MKTRRMGMMTALLLTAALFLILPGLMRTLLARQSGRVDASLRPPRLRTVTAWVMNGQMDDGRLMASACAAFEKQNPGVRTFLRNVTAEELYAEEAVLPDVLLFEPGMVAAPEKALLPLTDTSAPSGMHAGVCYAVPLWLAPHVLAVPQNWMQAEALPTPVPGSLLGAAPPVLQEEPRRWTAEDLPWPQIAASLHRPQGVALQQLLSMCPRAVHAALAQSETGEAQALTLREFLKTEDLCGVVMTPAVSDRVRMGALCRRSEEGAAFLRFLQSGMAQAALEYGLICPGQTAEAADAWTREAAALFSSAFTLPNAFEHTREELNQLCLQGFLRLDDPVMTLLRLR